jgi:PIN domain nuclease of toxin-antitoxin system
MIALDASALLAFLFRKAGHEQVGTLVDDACLSAVNLSEVVARFALDGYDASTVLQRITSTAIEIVPFAAADAALAASLLPATRPLGLLLGDRACLALALARQIPAVTADRSWARLRIGLDIRVVR